MHRLPPVTLYFDTLYSFKDAVSIHDSINGGIVRPCLLFSYLTYKMFSGQLGSDIQTASTCTGFHLPGSL